MLWHREAGPPRTPDSSFPSGAGGERQPSFRFPKLLALSTGGQDWLRGLGCPCAGLRACMRVCVHVCGRRLELGPTLLNPALRQRNLGHGSESCRRKVPASCPTSLLTPGFHLTKFQSVWEIQAKISDTAQSPQKLEF